MIQLTFTYGGITVDLMASGRAVLDGYFPEVSNDGTPVTDRIDVWLSGTSAEMQASIDAIELAIEHAKQHPDGADGCWINYAVNTTETLYRSRVTNGAVLHDARLDARWRQGRAKLGLAITRQPYWEGPETAVPLTNSNGTDVTDGLGVYNCNDASGTAPNKRVNYVEIAAADISGNRPTPAKLLLTNTFATNRLNNVWIGHNHTDPTNALWNLEAEAASGETGDADSGSSGGYDVSKTLTSDSEVTLFTWPLSAAMLSAAQGQWVHALPRFSYAPVISNIRFRFKLQWNVTTIWQSEQVLPDSNVSLAIRDLASFRLPPWLQNYSGLDGMNLVMTGQRILASSQLLTLDFLQLIPADNFRYLACVGYGVAQNSRIVDDGIGGEVYRDDGADTGRVGILTGYGDPILLQPGKLQRLYFLMHSNYANSAEVTRTISVQVKYRPRRSSL